MQVQIVGTHWGAYLEQGHLGAIYAPTAAMQYDAPTLIEIVRDYPANTPREALEQWVAAHSGDFSRVVDFAAINEGIEWENEESGDFYFDCVYGDEFEEAGYG